MAVAGGGLIGHGIVWPALGQARLEPVEAPSPRPGDIVVDITTSVVSPGTERAWFLGLPNARVDFPFRPGYAAAGVALEVGDGVEHIRPGDAVTLLGVPHQSLATVPSERVRRVPQGVETRQAAILQLGAVARYGVRRAGIAAGQPFVVVGAGLVGTLTRRLAAASGAGPCTVIASSHTKRSVAGTDADRFLAVTDGMDAVKAVGAPVVVEATGHADGLVTAVAAAAPGGRIVLLGSQRAESSILPAETIREKRLQVVGTHVCALERELALGLSNGITGEADAVLDALADGRLCVDDLFPEDDLDPREATRFYLRLVRDRTIVGVSFDWTGFPTSGERRTTAGRRRRSTTIGDPFSSAAGPVRFGMIGCGEIAVLSAEALSLAPNTSVTACHDLVPRLASDLASRLGAEPSATVDALLERSDVDAVLLSVPHHLHAPLAIQAAEAGKHVVVEKPPANDLAAAVGMVQSVERAGVTMSICFPQRYEVAAVLARQHIEAIGEPSGVEVRWFADKPPSYRYNGFTGRSPSDWRMRREQAGGGVLLMNLSHELDLIRHLLGLEVDEVMAVTTNIEGSGEVEDHVTVGVRYQNGAIGWFAATAAARGLQEGSLRVWGRDGHLDLKPVPVLYTLRAGCELPVERKVRLRPRAVWPARAVYFSRFATAVAEGRPPDVTGSDGLAVQALLSAAYQAADTRCMARPADLLKEAGA